MFWLMPWDDHHPSRHRPWATWALIAANVIVFGVMFTAGPAKVDCWFDRYALNAADPHWFQFISANFMHSGLLHLFFNMLFLYVLGDNVEDVLGPVGMLGLYFTGGLAGDALFVHANAGLAVPSVGASGCIATLAGAYAVMFFRRTLRVRLMFVVLPLFSMHLRAVWVLLMWFGMDLYLTLVGHGALDAGSSVNFVAHGAGFAVGLFAGLSALIYGAMRRYERLEVGDAWFGYWPARLDLPRHRRRRKE